MIEKEFNPDVLYGKIVHYYMDRRGYDKAKANTHSTARSTERGAKAHMHDGGVRPLFARPIFETPGYAYQTAARAANLQIGAECGQGSRETRGEKASASGVTMAAAAAMTDSGMQAGKEQPAPSLKGFRANLE